jgi:hypothetical protein
MTKSVNDFRSSSFYRNRDGHTQAPLILECPEQSNNPRVSTPQPHESIPLGEGYGLFVFLDEVCLLENLDGKLLASTDVSCKLDLVRAWFDEHPVCGGGSTHSGV